MKLLLVSIAFPPKSDPECIQTGRYYKGLIDSGEFEIQVLTSKPPTLFMDVDSSLDIYLSGTDDIYEIPVYESKILNFLVRKLRLGGVDWPDSKFTFYWQWKKIVKRIKRPDVIYSRSYPLSSAIMAYKISKYFGVPWIMHLSDPWSISPMHRRSKLNHRFHKRWEQKCFERAGSVCFTSEQTLDAYSKMYFHLKNKFEIIPNVPYDNVKGDHFERSDKLRIVYTGGLAGSRSPYFFLAALERAILFKPDLENKLEVIVAGNIDSKSFRMFANTKVKCLKHIGAVSLDKSILLQKSCDVLLSIDNPIDDQSQAMFIPSKLYDYIKSQKRIIALTTKESATEKFLTRFKADVMEFNDIDGVKLKLLEYQTRFENGEYEYFKQDIALPSEFELTYNTKKLSSLLRKQWTVEKSN